LAVFLPQAALLVWLATAGWLLRQVSGRAQAGLAMAAIVIGAVGFYVPAMLLFFALMLATFHACQRAWCSAALVLLWLFLGQFYYSLNQTLLAKSAMLAVAGLALLALGWLIRSWHKEAR